MLTTLANGVRENWLWNCPAPIAHGERCDEDGFGTAFALCKPLTDEEVELVAHALNMVPYYGGPGRGFARKLIIRRTKWHTLILQRFGVDI